MSATIVTLTRELDRRSADGIDVRLLWREQDDTVHVAVSDAKSGQSFAIQVRDRARALDVFNHPFAHSTAA